MHLARTSTRPLRWLVVLTLVAAAGCRPVGMSEARDVDAVQEPVRLIDGAVEVPARSEPYLVVERLGDEGRTVSLQAPGWLEFRAASVFRAVAPIGGRVIDLHVRTGDRVDAGDPLLTLQGPEIVQLGADRDRAAIALEAARTEWERQSRMVERGIGVESEKYAAGIRLAEAEAALAALDQAVEFIGLREESPSMAVVKAPIGGTVLSLAAAPGAMVEPNGVPLVELGDPSALWAVAEVLERDLHLIAPGAEASLTVAGAQDAIPGHVARIGAIVDRRLRRAPVYIELAERPETLRAGMFVRVAVARTLDGHVLPPSAVLIKDRRHLVYVHTGERRYEPREVRVHQTADGGLYVLEGLATGDRVLTRGALLLDGAAEQLL